jgi:putative glutamine amidotransferase
MASTTPLLGIMACNRAVGSETAHAVMHRYTTTSMALSDCQALLLPPITNGFDAAGVARVLDGFLLTGSPSNVGPHHYGDQCEGDGPFDPARDSVAFLITEAMIKAKKPVFGICRGFQELNVFFGGTLRRDVGHGAHGGLSHHAPDGASFDEMFLFGHNVTIEQGGLLETIHGHGPLKVNSVHYQGIGRLGDDLRCEAVADDGLIEAFSADQNGAPILAVQWHPEYQGFDKDLSEGFFGTLKKALKREAIG